MESLRLDKLDRAVVHALQINGRATFARIAKVLGTSEHTVSRRYRRLRSGGVLRVVGIPDAQRLGRVEWFLRLRCLPGGALPIAQALAGRDDISWVMLSSAGTEIICLSTTRSRGERDALLLGTMPKTRQIVEVEAACVLHTFYGGPTGWNGRARQLSAAQVTALTDLPVPETPIRHGRVSLDPQDERMLAELRRDGRSSLTDLAASLNCSVSAVSRRLDRLTASGLLYFDVEVPPELLGFSVEALLWIQVESASLHNTGQAVAAHPQVAYAAATSSTTNLLLAVGCRDIEELYEYISHEISYAPGVRAVQTAVVIRNIKRAGALLGSPTTPS